MTVRYYIPAKTDLGARLVVEAIERGAISPLPEYLDPQLAAEAFDRYPPSGKVGRKLWCIERRSVDDGRITNAWTIDEVGEKAAAAILFASIWLVGYASLYEVMA